MSSVSVGFHRGVQGDVGKPKRLSSDSDPCGWRKVADGVPGSVSMMTRFFSAMAGGITGLGRQGGVSQGFWAVGQVVQAAIQLMQVAELEVAVSVSAAVSRKKPATQRFGGRKG